MLHYNIESYKLVSLMIKYKMQILTRKLKCTLIITKRIYCVPDTVLIPSPTLGHLILKTALWSSYPF